MSNPETFADYLAEKPPFLKLPRHPFTRNGNTLTVQLGQAMEYCYADFTDLMLLTGTMGALNLALSHTEKAGGYIMMEGIRIVRYGDWDPTAVLHASITSTLVSGRKGKAVANIINEHHTVIYSMSNSYHIFNKPDFERTFLPYRKEDQQDMMQNVVMPVVKNRLSADACNYHTHIGPFTHQHCIGHFPGYPCVPASFILRCLFTGIVHWLQRNPGQLVIDNVEIFTTRMIPVDTPLLGATRVIHTSRHSYKFIVTLEDEKDPGIVYGHYIIDLRETPLS